jgi:hypothetical protein
MYKELNDVVEEFLQGLTSENLEKETWQLLRSSPDPDGGIDSYRLIRYFLHKPDLNNSQTGWAYQRIRPTLIQLYDQIPSLYFFTGD